MKLPTEKVPASTTSPVQQVLYGPPKIGKTTLLAQLPGNLIIDMEEGTEMIDALKVKCIGLERPKKLDNRGQYVTDENGRILLAESKEERAERHEQEEYYFEEIGAQILKDNKPYQLVSIDTVTKLEEWCEELATIKYRNTLQGKNFTGDTILSLPHGGGYRLLRDEYKNWIGKSKKLAPHIIFCGHLREKVISYDDRSVSTDDLDLTGKVRNITCQRTDAIGYVGREEDPEDPDLNHIYISYVTNDAINCGTRAPHLAGRKIRLGTSRFNGEYFELVETHWDKIYNDLTD